MPPAVAPISSLTSAYLNLIRFAAASAVVLHHCYDKNFGPSGLTRFFPQNGHGYVTVFFVISGYVISMVAEQKSASSFAIDRSVRIGIVAIPALLLSLLLSIWMPDISGGSYALAAEHPIPTLLLNAAFVSQSWNLDWSPFLNGPYWSLAYEVNYYVIFAMFTYAPRHLRWWLVFAASLVAGPKILLLFPCWLMGAAAYKSRNAIDISTSTAVLIAVAAPLMLLIAMHLAKTPLNQASDWFEFSKLTASEGFLRSWVVALGFAVHVWAISQMKIKRVNERIVRAAGSGASMSYSIYLLHLPLLYILVYIFGMRDSFTFLLLALPLTFFGCFVFSKVTEGNTRRLRSLVENKTFGRAPASETV
jgi:peptidoglycan/LPS O-acetylase OafA/YrhL